MKKKYNLRKIKAKRSYTPEELSELLNVHIQTVRDWHKSGLTPMKENTSPYLFIGEVIKRFLRKKLDARKVKLEDGEFYCLSCKKAVRPLNSKAINRGIKIGRNKDSFILKATCPVCSTKLNKFSSYQDSFAKGESLKQESKNLKSPNTPNDFNSLPIFNPRE